VTVVCKLVPLHVQGGKVESDYPHVEPYLRHPQYEIYYFLDPNNLTPCLNCLDHDYGVVMFYRVDCHHDGLPVNQCVQHLAGGLAPCTWAGPIMILKRRVASELIDAERFEDADLSMLEHVTHFFRHYTYPQDWRAQREFRALSVDM